MKIYTKKGDSGMTGLATGERVGKDDIRVQLYGECDELNSYIGYALTQMEGQMYDDVREQLRTQQNLLFELGSELAGFVAKPGQSVIYEDDILALERWMDTLSEPLEELKSFILPGGAPAAGVLHIARTVCRRLERQMTTCLHQHEEGGDYPGEAGAGKVIVMPAALKYINRLSDYLFVASRYINQVSGARDQKWASRGKQAKKEQK